MYRIQFRILPYISVKFEPSNRKTPVKDTAVPRIPGRRHRALMVNGITYSIGCDHFSIAASTATIHAYIIIHTKNIYTCQTNTFVYTTNLRSHHPSSAVTNMTSAHRISFSRLSKRPDSCGEPPAHKRQAHSP